MGSLTACEFCWRRRSVYIIFHLLLCAFNAGSSSEFLEVSQLLSFCLCVICLQDYFGCLVARMVLISGIMCVL